MDIFRLVNASLQEENQRLRCQFNKAAACVNDLFVAMNNYDVRFYFDPMSIDDCRCECVSPHEVNLLCTLKEVPFESCVLKGEINSGAVLIELNEDYTARLDTASWEDVISESNSGRRFLNGTKLLGTLADVIRRAICEIRQENDHPEILCRFTGDQVSIIVSLGLSGKFRVNLLPAIQATRHSGPLVKFDRKFQHIFKSLHMNDTKVETICLVAKPNCSNQDLLWRITFNDIENRIFNSSRFLCAPHCLFILEKLCAKFSPFWGTGGHLMRYHLQTIILREFRAHPRSKEWVPEKFHRRLKGVLTSFCGSLRATKCLNIFTDVNVFSYFDAETLSVLAGKLSKFKVDASRVSSLL